jgi:CRP-like cAMP-binding protein
MSVKRRALPTPRKPLSTNLNRLLAAVPPDDYERLARSIDVIPLKLKELLHKPGDQIEFVYFPGGGFLSVVTVLEDGRMVEVATIGREGAVGVLGLARRQPSQSATMVQGEAETCYRMSTDAFLNEMNRHGPFYELMTDYAQALVGFIMQSTACNAVHSLEQRLARWLLMAHDRMAAQEFPLTQEFVAMMLGAARPTVSLIAGTLQSAGLIEYHRGLVTVLDREKLEAASCECYRVTTEALQAVTNGPRNFG